MMQHNLAAWLGLAAAILFFVGLPMLIKGSPRVSRIGSYLVPPYHVFSIVLICALPTSTAVTVFGIVWAGMDGILDIAHLHGLDYSTIMPIRRGAHLFAGLWTLTAAMSMPILVTVIGILAGVSLIADALVTGPAKLREYIFYGSLLLGLWLFAVSLSQLVYGNIW
jgi:hypothetical protein